MGTTSDAGGTSDGLSVGGSSRDRPLGSVGAFRDVSDMMHQEDSENPSLENLDSARRSTGMMHQEDSENPSPEILDSARRSTGMMHQEDSENPSLILLNRTPDASGGYDASGGLGESWSLLVDLRASTNLVLVRMEETCSYIAGSYIVGRLGCRV